MFGAGLSSSFTISGLGMVSEQGFSHIYSLGQSVCAPSGSSSHLQSFMSSVTPSSPVLSFTPFLPLITLLQCSFNLLFRIFQFSLLHPLSSLPIRSCLQAPTIFHSWGHPLALFTFDVHLQFDQTKI